VRRRQPLLYEVLGLQLPLIAANCAVLGVTLLSVAQAHSFVDAALYGLGTALGFAIVLVLFAGLRERIAASDVPAPFRGPAILLVTAALMALGLHGLCGARGRMIGILLLAILALALAASLVVTARRLRFDPEALVGRIDAQLPQTQCAQCGYPGCQPYARAIARGEADINQCPPGGRAHHRGARTPARARARSRSIRAAASTRNACWRASTRAPASAARCCIQACPVDAIVGAAKLMHSVIEAECTGCELCVAPCPVDCIEMIPVADEATPWRLRRPPVIALPLTGRR
jgi:electron transport complex protein RnfB